MEDERAFDAALTDGAPTSHVAPSAHGPSDAAGHEATNNQHASLASASASASRRRGSSNHHRPQSASDAPAPPPAGHAAAHLPFVAPADLLRPHFRPISSQASRTRAGTANSAPEPSPMHPQDREQIEGLRAVRAFLKVRTSYDVLPLSYRLIIFDTSLLVKKSLNILTQCGRRQQ